jgi:thioredoxin-dependent peroxiredoxin
MLREGAPFPDFSLQDQRGATVTRESLLGTRAVVYFYPKDDTSGCTAEACEFREESPRFEGVRVVGVSPDGVSSHRRFADKYDLSFPLLADVDHALAEACGVWVEKTMYGKKYMGVARTTFLLDEAGVVQRVWRNVKPQGHALEALSTAVE